MNGWTVFSFKSHETPNVGVIRKGADFFVAPKPTLTLSRVLILAETNPFVSSSRKYRRASIANDLFLRLTDGTIDVSLLVINSADALIPHKPILTPLKYGYTLTSFGILKSEL